MRAQALSKGLHAIASAGTAVPGQSGSRGRLALGGSATLVAVISPAVATSAVPLSTPGLWLTGVERGLLLIGLCVALGGISGRGLAKNYKGDHPAPLPEPWVLPGSLLGMAGAAALIVTALADPHLAAALAHPLVPGPRAAATLAIAIVEFA